MNEIENKIEYTYPQSLNRLLENKRIPSLFLGAGFSLRYLKNFTQWEKLLINIANLIGINKNKFDLLKERICIENKELSDGEVKQRIATELEKLFLTKLYEDEKFAKNFFTEDELIKHKGKLFKLLVAKQFEDKKLNPETYLQTELNLFKQLRKKISCIITTNYDDFLENDLFNNEFDTIISQSDLYLPSITGYGEIYKIHGSITVPESIVLTKNDYDTYKNQNKLTIAKILNILLQGPMIFIGCSLTDETIIDLLSSLVSSVNPELLPIIEKNLILVSHKKGWKVLKESTFQIHNKNLNIPITCIETDNFTKLYYFLNKFTPYATPREIRRYKQLIKKLIIKNEEGRQTLLITPKNIKDFEDGKELIFALSDKIQQNINVSTSAISYKSYTNEVIVLDVLFEKHELVPIQVLNDWYSYNTRKSTEYHPILYYYNNVNVTEINTSILDKILQYKSYLSSKLEEIKNDQKLKLLALKDFLKEQSSLPISSIYETMLKNYLLKNWTKDEFRRILQNEYERNHEIIKNSCFRRAIAALDFE